MKSYLRSVLFTLHNKLMGFYFIGPFSLMCCKGVSAWGKTFILRAKHIKMIGNILMVVLFLFCFFLGGGLVSDRGISRIMLFKESIMKRLMKDAVIEPSNTQIGNLGCKN